MSKQICKHIFRWRFLHIFPCKFAISSCGRHRRYRCECLSYTESRSRVLLGHSEIHDYQCKHYSNLGTEAPPVWHDNRIWTLFQGYYCYSENSVKNLCYLCFNFNWQNIHVWSATLKGQWQNVAHSGYDILATARAHVCGVIHLKLDILQTLTCVQRRDKVGYNCFWAQETQYAPVSSWWCTTGCCWCTRYSLVLLQVALRMAFWVYAWMQLQMNSKKNMEIMHGFLFCFWVELKKKRWNQKNMKFQKCLLFFAV